MILNRDFATKSYFFVQRGELSMNKKPKTKVCSKCKKTFTATTEYFNINKQNKQGLHSYCKDCRSKARAERYKKEKEKGITKQYYQDNKTQHIVAQLKKRGYPDITAGQLQSIIDMFKNNKGISVCPYCNREMTDESYLHIDHIIPYSKAKDVQMPLNNLIPVCKYCNRSKQDDNFIVWFRDQFFYDKEREQKIIEYAKPLIET